MEEKKKDGRGGKRPGAGRPKGIKTPYKNITIGLPVEYVEKLHQAAEKKGVSIGAFIKLAVDEELKDQV